MTDNTSSLFCNLGSESTVLKDDEIRSQIDSFLKSMGDREDVLILPPDYTRFHSQAGKITRMVCEHYNFVPKATDDDGTTIDKSSSNPDITILPALGTHAPMTETQITSMFGEQLGSKDDPNPFRVHDWRNDVVTIGHVPNEMVLEATRGLVDEPWPAQLNKLVWEKRNHDSAKQPHKTLVLSIGQVVPHEVLGMANYNKNLFVGVGGVEAINLSHFIGAVYGMEKMMGRASNPLRSILNHASEQFLGELDLWYILTVIGSNKDTGDLEVKGLFVGNDIECYSKACDLSLRVNFTMLDTSPSKVVVYLDGDEFHSTWLGNKAIYRTRMAIADGGHLIILAPGVKRFGEDDRIDELIRKYGYVGTDNVMKALKENPEELKDNLGAVAHLIHGSSEGRFSVTYCPGGLTQQEIESVGFQYADLQEMLKLYPVDKLKDGWNDDEKDGGKFFYISNPALGLWATPDRFED